MMEKKNRYVLIVEDEVLIADFIANVITRNGYKVAGTAISYHEAKDVYLNKHPDLVLLDIRLNGPKTGVDFARYLRSRVPVTPFIFLTSQMDRSHLEAAKLTQPAGYLVKPIRPENLLPMLEIALHNARMQAEKDDPFLEVGGDGQRIRISDILFLKAEHVYVRFYLANGRSVLHRATLSDLHEQLDNGQFIRTHRSYIINLMHVDQHESVLVKIKDHSIPVSRARRSEVVKRLSVRC